MTTDCYPIPGPAHPATHAPHPGHVHAGLPHGAVHHAPIHHLPVYGPPPPSVALNCVRTPGELPALPGGGVAHPLVQGASPAAGDLGPAFYGQAPIGSAVTPSLGSGALGLAQAALVAGGLGLAAAGGLAMVAPVSTGPTQPVGPIYAAAAPGATGPGFVPTLIAPAPTLVAPGPTLVAPGPGAGSPGQPIIVQQSPPGPSVTPQPDQPAIPTPIPEPGTIALFAAGALAVFAARRHVRRPPSASAPGNHSAST